MWEVCSPVWVLEFLRQRSLKKFAQVEGRCKHTLSLGSYSCWPLLQLPTFSVLSMHRNTIRSQRKLPGPRLQVTRPHICPCGCTSAPQPATVTNRPDKAKCGNISTLHIKSVSYHTGHIYFWKPFLCCHVKCQSLAGLSRPLALAHYTHGDSCHSGNMASRSPVNYKLISRNEG